jgi:hypothetical protein
MADAKAPTKLRTDDNIEWSFFETLTDFDKLDKFREKHQCKVIPAARKCRRIRLLCNRKLHNNQCSFMLLAMQTTKQRFHVYKHGEHNHRPITPRRSNF